MGWTERSKGLEGLCGGRRRRGAGAPASTWGESQGLRVGLQGPAAPFLGRPSPTPLTLAPFQPLRPLGGSFHKRCQPLSRSSPSNLLGLSPSAPQKDFPGHRLTCKCACPSPAVLPAAPRWILAHCTCRHGAYYILCLMLITRVPGSSSSPSQGRGVVRPLGPQQQLPAARPQCQLLRPSQTVC